MHKISSICQLKKGYGENSPHTPARTPNAAIENTDYPFIFVEVFFIVIRSCTFATISDGI
jgi:hypothetical protein